MIGSLDRCLEIITLVHTCANVTTYLEKSPLLIVGVLERLYCSWFTPCFQLMMRNPYYWFYFWNAFVVLTDKQRNVKINYSRQFFFLDLFVRIGQFSNLRRKEPSHYFVIMASSLYKSSLNWSRPHLYESSRDEFDKLNTKNWSAIPVLACQFVRYKCSIRMAPNWNSTIKIPGRFHDLKLGVANIVDTCCKNILGSFVV